MLACKKLWHWLRLKLRPDELIDHGDVGLPKHSDMPKKEAHLGEGAMNYSTTEQLNRYRDRAGPWQMK